MKGAYHLRECSKPTRVPRQCTCETPQGDGRFHLSRIACAAAGHRHDADCLNDTVWTATLTGSLCPQVLPGLEGALERTSLAAEGRRAVSRALAQCALPTDAVHQLM
jgi:hypothetical protein